MAQGQRMQVLPKLMAVCAVCGLALHFGRDPERDCTDFGHTGVRWAQRPAND